MGIKVQKEYGKSRCDMKKKSFLRPRCKIAVKNQVLGKKHEDVCSTNFMERLTVRGLAAAIYLYLYFNLSELNYCFYRIFFFLVLSFRYVLLYTCVIHECES